MTAAIAGEPRIELRREEVTRIPGRHRHHRHRSADQRCAGRRDLAPHRLGPPLLLRQHQPDRGGRFRRYVDRILGVALRQIEHRHRRLSQLPVQQRRVRALSRRAAEGRERRFAHRGGRHAVFRSVPADRGDRAPRTRHAALRADEADGPHRSAHRPAALGRRATAPGEPARRQLQPGRLSEPPEVRRAGAHSAHDPRAGARRVYPLRPDPSQHLHQRARAAHADAATALAPRGLLRRPDLGRRGLRRIDRDRTAGGHARGGARDRRRAAGRRRARPRSARSATTSPAPIPRITSPPTSRSICCRSSTTPRASASATTRRRATPRCAGARRPRFDEYLHAHV